MDMCNQTDSSDDAAHRFSPTLLHFAAFCIIVFIIVGLAGNLLTILALTRTPRLRNATAAFIISLSVADFFFCAFNLPFSASRFLHHGWIHSPVLCIVFPFLRYANVAVSLLSIVAITINRYVLIVHPSLYQKVYRKRYIAIMIATLWLFSFLMVVPTLLGKWGKFAYDCNILNCTIVEVDGESPKSFLFVFGFLLPCIVIVLCYTRIFLAVRTSQRKMRKHSVGSCADQVKRRGYDSQQKQEEWRITRMILIIFVSFVVCYLPITLVKVADKRARYPALQVLAYLLVYMSACINPVIYVVSNRQYRVAYKGVLLWRRPRALSFSGSYEKTDTSMSRTIEMNMIVITASPEETKAMTLDNTEVE